jgi:translation initiation factor IF-3
MDYGKWKYQQKQKEKRARSRQHQMQLKEIRLRPKTDQHDLEVKVKHAREFLEVGHRVQFTLMFSGREMAHRDLGEEKLQHVVQMLEEVGKVVSLPRMTGRRMTMTVAPSKTSAGQSNRKEQTKNQEEDEGKAEINVQAENQ